MTGGFSRHRWSDPQQSQPSVTDPAPVVPAEPLPIIAPTVESDKSASQVSPSTLARELAALTAFPASARSFSPQPIRVRRVVPVTVQAPPPQPAPDVQVQTPPVAAPVDDGLGEAQARWDEILPAAEIPSMTVNQSSAPPEPPPLSEPEMTAEVSEHAAPLPFYSGHLRLMNRNDTRTGMTAKFVLTEELGLAPPPFRGIKSGASNGQRLRVLFCTVSEEDDPVPVYAGEAMLAYWSEDGAGSYVTVKLDDGPDGHEVHPFKHYRADKDDGELFAAAIWLLREDEQVQRVVPQAKKTFHMLGPAQQSQILCKTDSKFQSWVIERGVRDGLRPTVDESAAETAARIVRHYCGISSRSEFKTNPLSVTRWQELFYDFRTWRNSQSNRGYFT